MMKPSSLDYGCKNDNKKTCDGCGGCSILPEPDTNNPTPQAQHGASAGNGDTLVEQEEVRILNAEIEDYIGLIKRLQKELAGRLTCGDCEIPNGERTQERTRACMNRCGYKSDACFKPNARIAEMLGGGGMRKTDARVIKKWRKQGNSWRMIATLAAEKWPDRHYAVGNQLQGQELCYEAARVLGEEI